MLQGERKCKVYLCVCVCVHVMCNCQTLGGCGGGWKISKGSTRGGQWKERAEVLLCGDDAQVDIDGLNWMCVHVCKCMQGKFWPRIPFLKNKMFCFWEIKLYRNADASLKMKDVDSVNVSFFKFSSYSCALIAELQFTHVQKSPRFWQLLGVCLSTCVCVLLPCLFLWLQGEDATWDNMRMRFYTCANSSFTPI